MDSKPTINHKEMKAKGRSVLKRHYLLYVILCLIIVFWGAETEPGNIALDTSRNLNIVEDAIRPQGSSGIVTIYLEEVKKRINAGTSTVQGKIDEYKTNERVKSILGRENGVFAKAVNLYTSGDLYTKILLILQRIFNSTRVATAVMLVGALGLYFVVWMFLFNVMGVAVRRFMLESLRYDKVPASHALYIFSFKNLPRVASSMLLTYVYLRLYVLTIVGGPIKFFSYFLVPYILAENPEIKPKEAITLSRRMMDGHKMELFKLCLSFAGWYLIGILTLGITDILYGMPYRYATYCHYYEYVRAESKEKKIPGSELLSRDYLFAKADEELLDDVYSDIAKKERFIARNTIPLTGLNRFTVKYLSLWLGSLSERTRYQRALAVKAQTENDRLAKAGKIYPTRLDPIWKPRYRLVSGQMSANRCYTVWSVVAMFFLFAFMGWVWEVILHLITHGEFVNRGMLTGPWLPIYGAGSMLVLLLGNYFRKNRLAELIFATALCGVLEYLTSYVTEAKWGMRWWDYSGYFLNLDGRICAEGLVVFAISSMMVVYVAGPFLDNIISRIKIKRLAPLLIILSLLMLVDIGFSSVKPNTGSGITDYSSSNKSLLMTCAMSSCTFSTPSDLS